MQNKRINKISYGKIFYIQKMEVELEDITILKKDDEKKSKINSYLNIFKSQFGEKNATYNEVNSKFEIIAHKQAIAISSDEKDWKFIIAEKKQEQILKDFIPQELLNDLK